MTNTPKTGADTGLPAFKDTTTKYVKTVMPIQTLTEPEWYEAAQEEIRWMELANECREALFVRNGDRIPPDGVDADIWRILTVFTGDADEVISAIVDGFDWPIKRVKIIEGWNNA